jgi:hypothetical protein
MTMAVTIHISEDDRDGAPIVLLEPITLPTLAEAVAYLENVDCDTHTFMISVECPHGADGWHFDDSLCPVSHS